MFLDKLFHRRKKEKEVKLKYSDEELQELHDRAHRPIREATPCFFKDGISRDDFAQIVKKADSRIRRIIKTDISGPIVNCTVVSESTSSEWHFTVDFNDWGHLTGNYWLKSENNDSGIPERFAGIVSEGIKERYTLPPIEIVDYKDL